MVINYTIRSVRLSEFHIIFTVIVSYTQVYRYGRIKHISWQTYQVLIRIKRNKRKQTWSHSWQPVQEDILRIRTKILHGTWTFRTLTSPYLLPQHTPVIPYPNHTVIKARRDMLPTQQKTEKWQMGTQWTGVLNGRCYHGHGFLN